VEINVAMISKKIIKLRKKLDKLDNSMLSIVKKRSLLVDQVLKNKNFKKDIIDKKRISVILKNIYKKSKKMNIDPKITKKIWYSMIRAFIEYEFKNFKK
jgi:chorismate mutase